jgi:hypothetical protein
MTGRTWNEALIRNFPFETVKHSAFSNDDECVSAAVSAVMNHLLGAANFICQHPHGIGALRMGNDSSVRMFAFDLIDAVSGEFDMNVT